MHQPRHKSSVRLNTKQRIYVRPRNLASIILEIKGREEGAHKCCFLRLAADAGMTQTFPCSYSAPLWEVMSIQQMPLLFKKPYGKGGGGDLGGLGGGGGVARTQWRL